MKNKITILYDNTDNYTNIEETKEFLFDTFSEERGWKTINDIPEDVIYEEIDAQDNLAWQDFYEQIYKILSHDTYLLDVGMDQLKVANLFVHLTIYSKPYLTLREFVFMTKTDT